jgi:hypothetical protein
MLRHSIFARAVFALIMSPCACLAQTLRPDSPPAGSRISVVIVDSLPSASRLAVLLYRQPATRSQLIIRRGNLDPRYVTRALAIVRRGIDMRNGGAEARVSITVSGNAPLSPKENQIGRILAAAGATSGGTVAFGYGRQKTLELSF